MQVSLFYAIMPKDLASAFMQTTQYDTANMSGYFNVITASATDLRHHGQQTPMLCIRRRPAAMTSYAMTSS